jgi:hypothetical protein
MEQSAEKFIIYRKINGQRVGIELTEKEVDEILDRDKNDELTDRVEKGLKSLMGEGAADVFIESKSDIYFERLLDKVVELENEIRDHNFQNILRSAIYEANKLDDGADKEDFVFKDDIFDELKE